MAGIGFRLQKLLLSDNISSLAMAYGYSAIIASGPWMLSMLSLIGIGLFMTASPVSPGETDLPINIFCTVITYAYAGTNILGGLMHLGVSRYVADRLYSNEIDRILPAFLYSASAILLLGLGCAGSLLVFSGLPPAEAISVFIIFQSLSLTWLAMLFLSAAKGYGQIVWGFLGANVLGVILSIAGYGYYGLNGAFFGYALGQFSLAMWLSWRIFSEFPSYAPLNHELPAYLWKNRLLAATGFLFNLGIWIDKIIVWYSPEGREVTGLFRCSNVYDISLFFAYLTTIPAMSLFIIRVETSFYKNYSIYFNAVICGGALSAIERGKQKIVESLKLSVERILTTQGVFTLFLIVIAPWLADMFNLASSAVPILRWALLAAFLQVLLLFLFIFFLYFDWKIRAFALAAMFCGCNATFTWTSLAWGDEFLGLGYLFALLLTLCIGIIIFVQAMNNLEYETFAKQQMSS